MLYFVLNSLYKRINALENSSGSGSKSKLGVKLEMQEPQPGEWRFERINLRKHTIEAITLEEELVDFLGQVEEMARRARRNYRMLDGQSISLRDANNETQSIQLRWHDDTRFIETDFIHIPNSAWHKYAFKFNKDNILLLLYYGDDELSAEGFLPGPLKSYLFHGDFAGKIYNDPKQFTTFFPNLALFLHEIPDPYIMRTDGGNNAKVRFMRRGGTLEISYTNIEYLYDIQITRQDGSIFTNNGRKLSLDECKEVINSWLVQSSTRGSSFPHLIRVPN